MSPHVEALRSKLPFTSFRPGGFDYIQITHWPRTGGGLVFVFDTSLMCVLDAEMTAPAICNDISFDFGLQGQAGLEDFVISPKCVKRTEPALAVRSS